MTVVPMYCLTVTHRHDQIRQGPLALPSYQLMLESLRDASQLHVIVEPGPLPASTGPGLLPLRTCGQFRAVSTEKDDGPKKETLAPRCRPCDHPPLAALKCPCSPFSFLWPLPVSRSLVAGGRGGVVGSDSAAVVELCFAGGPGAR